MAEQPDKGWYVRYFTLEEPCADWGIVSRKHENYSNAVWVDVIGRNREWWTYTNRPDHCVFYPEPPDEFFVWQAKRALLGEDNERNEA